jgi:anti-sigma factor RsiW
MTERLARLEAQYAHVDKTLDEIKAEQRDQRQILGDIRDRLARMPTVNGLWGMIATVLAIGIAIAGLTFAVAQWAARAPI